MRFFKSYGRNLLEKVKKCLSKEAAPEAAAPNQPIAAEYFMNQKEIFEKVNFLYYENLKMNEIWRRFLFSNPHYAGSFVSESKDSFDYQWFDVNEGCFLSSDASFMNQLTSHICKITELNDDWFQDKKVLDAGCGSGRYSYGLLKLGAQVVSVDQSQWAVNRTSELCQEFADRHSGAQRDILDWEDPEDFDLVFCFGVVHHTGNTYYAIHNMARKVKPGGRLFLMVYGVPQSMVEFQEINSYEELRWQLRNADFKTRKDFLINKFGPDLAHGWFDAISPRINDLLTFEEIVQLLNELGFSNVHRTLENRNHHLVADKQ